MVPQNIYVVVLVHLRVVSPRSRKLRFVVNSQYHRVVTSRLLLAPNCEPFTSLAGIGGNWTRDLQERSLSFRVTNDLHQQHVS